jgi:hypothetical protein
MIFGTTLAAWVSLAAIAIPSTLAVAQARISFKKPPDLVSVTTTYNEVYAWAARYYFTISLPENAGESLGRVTINQRQGFEEIEFKLKDTKAFEGTPRREGEKLTLKEVTKDPQSPTVSVTFDPPVQPGKTVTIELRPVRNPSLSGVYIFGVTAFPAVENPYGLYLGVGRLQFYENGLDFLFR